MTEKKRVFEKTSTFDVTLEKMTDFHANSSPAQLSPPPIFVQVRRDERISLTNGELEFTLWVAFIPIHWLARHEPLTSGHGFADLMIKGPMAYWRHEHIFTSTDKGTQLTDRVTLLHKGGWQGLLTRLMFDGIPLKMLFFYRHLRTRWALQKAT